MTKSQIVQRLRRKSCVERLRRCGAGHTLVTREFLYRPSNPRWITPVVWCHKCTTGHMLVKRQNNRGIRQSGKFEPKSNSMLYETYGAEGRTRVCDQCKQRLITYEVAYPLVERRFDVHYCDVDGCGKLNPVVEGGKR